MHRPKLIGTVRGLGDAVRTEVMARTPGFCVEPPTFNNLAISRATAALRHDCARRDRIQCDPIYRQRKLQTETIELRVR